MNVVFSAASDGLIRVMKIAELGWIDVEVTGFGDFHHVDNPFKTWSEVSGFDDVHRPDRMCSEVMD